MQRCILIISLIGIIIAACSVPGCLDTGDAGITSVTTDKDLYHSHEIMNITVSLSSHGETGNATLRLKGIQDEDGHFQLNQDIPLTLSPGPNTFVYDHQLPHCSSCSGLLEGMYKIDASLIVNGDIVSNMTHTFQLKQ